MRTLFALILFASVAVGQTIVEPKFIEWKQTTQQVWLRIDTNMTAHFSRDGGYKAIMLDRDTIWSKWWESIPSEPSDGMAVAEIDTNGQERTTEVKPSEWLPYFPTQLVRWEKEQARSDSVDWSREYFTVAFVELYSRYRKACYDDSTLITSTWEWDSAASAKGNWSTVMKKVRDNYVHWRTPSLPGFIDWLEKARNR